MSQDELMHKDECLLVDHLDNIVGHASKYDAHKFTSENPTGLLHRAFSVFLFTRDGKLILQQRAADKITFPNVWTNTCCSHPLYGYYPCEVDNITAIEDGSVRGIKSAARRKLQHELGIEPNLVPHSALKFLTRIQYCAADSVLKNGVYSVGVWGEHEIDYILFARLALADTEISSILQLNQEEVQNVRCVTMPELLDMMDSKSGLSWSPWFRIIVQDFLSKWWADLDETMLTNKWVDTRSIHRAH